MILKILFTVIAVVAALFVLRVAGGESNASIARKKSRRALAKRQRESAQMVRCPNCNAWYDPVERCSCSSPS